MSYYDTYYINSWHKHLCKQAKSSAKRKDLEFNLTPEFILEVFNKQNGKCYWLGINLISTGTKLTPNQPSLDRLDNAKGYTQDNVVIASTFANYGRNRLNAEEFKRFLQEELIHTNE